MTRIRIRAAASLIKAAFESDVGFCCQNNSPAEGAFRESLREGYLPDLDLSQGLPADWSRPLATRWTSDE